MTDAGVRQLFERYARLFNQALAGDVDMAEVASLYAAEFIGAGPGGVRAGKNDAEFRQAMAEGYARYRAIGTKAMRIRQVRIFPLDDRHCLAQVAWAASYARNDQPDVTIEFEVQYFVQTLNETPRVFGWVVGDEQALLRAHGLA